MERSCIKQLSRERLKETLIEIETIYTKANLMTRSQTLRTLRILITEDVQADVKKAAEAKQIIKYVKDKINNYVTDTKEIQFYNPFYSRVHIQYKDLPIVITDRPAEEDGGYSAKQNMIVIYNARIKAKENEKKSTFLKTAYDIDVKFDENALLHELIHYFDATRQYKGSGRKVGGGEEGRKALAKDTSKKIHIDPNSKASKEEKLRSYYNDPLELNGYFFDSTFPDVLERIEKDQSLVDGSFKNFFEVVESIGSFRTFYHWLTDKNKRRIQKRLAVLYMELKNNPQKVKDLAKVDLDHVEQEKEKVGWLKKIWNKLSA